MSVESAHRGAGRPRSFDPEGKVAAAMELFWQNGYEATSLDLLTRRLGLSRSSFYACFGSKRGVLKRGLECYSAEMLARLSELARSGAGDPVPAMLHALAHTDDPAHGCLLVNCIAELAPHDAELADFARRHFEAVEAMVAARLTGPEAGRAARARALVALAVGALTMRKSGMDAAAVGALLAAATPLLSAAPG